MRNITLAALAALYASCGSVQSKSQQGSPLPVGLWADATASTIGETGDWTNKVELADLNGDGPVDLLFANGGDYREPGTPVMSRVFLNRGPGEPFEDASEQILGSGGMLVRAIKTADVNSDGAVDIFLAATYQTPSKLLLGEGGGKFADRSEMLPEHALSLGDAEFGDADLDGDLDLILADWGAGNPMENEGGRPRLWLNDGSGGFTDATAQRVPELLVRFSWDLEFVDVDNDSDLDVMISSKLGDGGFLLVNDGRGYFHDETEGWLPQFTNNYEFEPMDLNGDGYMDTATINDGGLIEGERGSHKENIFLNSGKGGFEAVTETALPPSENLGYDDNRIGYLDYDSDGDADVIVGSLSGPDRVLVNDGEGSLRVATEVFIGPETKGTLGFAVADLNGDAKADVAMAQGEFEGHEAEMIFFGEGIAPDAAAPVLAVLGVTAEGEVRARVHDSKSPTRPFDLPSVTLKWIDGETAMTWYGEHLWTGQLPSGASDAEICATDAAGNSACIEAGSEMLTKLVPDDFDPPWSYEGDGYRLEPLRPAIAKVDYDAYMGSIEHIREHFTRGGSWPNEDITMEDAYLDMRNEQRRFRNRSSFAYAALTPDGSKELGCVYIGPSAKQGYDAAVRSWVIQEEFDKGFGRKLLADAKAWVERDWPFQAVAYPGVEIPWEHWNSLPDKP